MAVGLNVAMNKIESLKEDIIDLQDQIKVLENVSRNEKIIIREREVKINELKQEKSSLQSCENTKNMEIKILRNVHREMKEAQQKKKDLIRKTEEIQSELSKREKYMEELREIGVEKNDTTVSLESDFNLLKRKVEDVKRNVKDLTRLNLLLVREDSKDLLNDLQMKNYGLKKKLLQENRERPKIADSLKENTPIFRQLKEELSKKQRRNAKLKQNIITLEVDQQQLQKEEMELKEELMELKEELNDNRRELKMRQANLKKKIEEYENYKYDNVGLTKMMSKDNNTPISTQKNRPESRKGKRTELCRSERTESCRSKITGSLRIERTGSLMSQRKPWTTATGYQKPAMQPSSKMLSKNINTPVSPQKNRTEKRMSKNNEARRSKKTESRRSERSESSRTDRPGSCTSKRRPWTTGYQKPAMRPSSKMISKDSNISDSTRKNRTESRRSEITESRMSKRTGSRMSERRPWSTAAGYQGPAVHLSSKMISKDNNNTPVSAQKNRTESHSMSKRRPWTTGNVCQRPAVTTTILPIQSCSCRSHYCPTVLRATNYAFPDDMMIFSLLIPRDL